MNHPFFANVTVEVTSQTFFCEASGHAEGPYTFTGAFIAGSLVGRGDLGDIVEPCKSTDLDWFDWEPLAAQYEAEFGLRPEGRCYIHGVD